MQQYFSLIRSFIRSQPVLRRLQRRLSAASPSQRKTLSVSAALLGVACFVIFGVTLVRGGGDVNVLANGSFEGGFSSVPGCGIVAEGWDCFHNGGAAAYGFYDEQWDPVVADGEHGQLIEISTRGQVTADADRYAGLSQTVRVQPGEHYKLSLQGMIRTTNLEGDPWRYRVQVGWSEGPHGDWRHVHNWEDVGWNDYFEREKPGNLSSYQTTLVPHDEVITVFVRVWKKWGVANEELDVNLDAISLVGPEPGRKGGQGGPQNYRAQLSAPRQEPEQPRHAEQDEWRPEPSHDGPAPGQPLSCGGPNLIYNGSFEDGFIPIALGHVGRGWGAFTNGGAANYGFYDEEWDPVVADGKHGQLIEINSKGFHPADADRYSGIFQRIGGLRPGATYELSLYGLLRGTGGEEDPHRFEAQWGITDGPEPNWHHIRHWTGIDLGPIYPREEPVAMGYYKARFVAPASQIVLFIRGWKKWGVSEVEMDLNLDSISLVSCDGGYDGPHGPEPKGPGAGPKGDGPKGPSPEECVYIVKPGDSLSAIAQRYGVSVGEIMKANAIQNANIIYVGQKFLIPGCGGGDGYEKPEPKGESPRKEPERQPEPDRKGEPKVEPDHESKPELGPKGEAKPSKGDDEGHSATYRVRAGDTLSAIAAEYGVDMFALARANNIDNVNLLYVGQVLRIP